MTEDVAEPVMAHGNAVFGLEARGFDHIPEAERNMTLRQVGPMWLGANLNMFSISVGCVSITLGLTLWQALAACVVGNLPYVYVALASVGAVRRMAPNSSVKVGGSARVGSSSPSTSSLR